jgi:methylglutamate dehydrogenase subunit B
MLISCPFCGRRESSEFAYRGDATLVRPEGENADEPTMYAYVYLRTNPAGLHEEHWYHTAGCRQWLRIRRDTRTHVILDVTLAAGGAL